MMCCYVLMFASHGGRAPHLARARPHATPLVVPGQVGSASRAGLLSQSLWSKARHFTSPRRDSFRAARRVRSSLPAPAAHPRSEPDVVRKRINIQPEKRAVVASAKVQLPHSSGLGCNMCGASSSDSVTHLPPAGQTPSAAAGRCFERWLLVRRLADWRARPAPCPRAILQC